MLVCKHIDGDISFMESSQHIIRYYGVDLLMNNALRDNGAHCEIAPMAAIKNSYAMISLPMRSLSV